MKKLLCLLLCAMLLFSSCALKRNNSGFFAMGSAVSVISYGADPTETIRQRIEALELSISCRNQTANAFALNKDGSVEDPVLANAVTRAIEICALSGGRYDIAIYQLTKLWDFDSAAPVPPDGESISAALENVGYENITVDGSIVTLANSVEIDLGSLGKGLACDEAAKVLAELNLNGLVSVGGSICAVGTKPDGREFEIGIRNPFSENTSDCIARLKLKDAFISTSGSYEKKFTYNGKEYHHIIDPSTGYPLESELVSVTVVAKNGLESDALSTAAFCMGRESAKPLLERFGASAVYIYRDGSVVASESLKGALFGFADESSVSYD